MVARTSSGKSIVPNNSADSISTPPFADPQPEVKALPDTNRLTYYGRVLESIFADPVYREVLYETAAKQLQKLRLERSNMDGSKK